MLKVVKEQQGDTLTLRFSGSIIEGMDLRELCGYPLPEKVRVGTKEVSRINSEGVKVWMLYFRDVARDGTQLTFFECSPAVVEQANLVMNFLEGGLVESAYLPYACKDCKGRLMALVPLADMRKMKSAKRIPDLRCTRCGQGTAVFDDLAEEYLRFIK